MNFSQKKSFIAHVECNDKRLTFLDSILGERYVASEANVLTTLPPYRRHPSGVQRSTPKFLAFFECYDDYYNIQIRSADYFGKYLSKNANGKLGAFPGAGAETTSFNLLDDNERIITLDDLSSRTANIYLKARNAGIIKANKHPTSGRDAYYFNDYSGEKLKFNFEILERNVPYPTSTTPDQYNDYDED
ncbi:hypothetical protein [Pseudomonas sp. PB3P13]